MDGGTMITSRFSSGILIQLIFFSREQKIWASLKFLRLQAGKSLFPSLIMKLPIQPNQSILPLSWYIRFSWKENTKWRISITIEKSDLKGYFHTVLVIP